MGQGEEAARTKPTSRQKQGMEVGNGVTRARPEGKSHAGWPDRLRCDITVRLWASVFQ